MMNLRAHGRLYLVYVNVVEKQEHKLDIKVAETSPVLASKVSQDLIQKTKPDFSFSFHSQHLLNMWHKRESIVNQDTQVSVL